jgi:hypothetical protein
MFWWIVGLVFGCSGFALAVIAWLHRDVIGYQDEQGFHYGAPVDDSLGVLEEQPKRRRGRRG